LNLLLSSIHCVFFLTSHFLSVSPKAYKP
jgi:hypothetical protein